MDLSLEEPVKEHGITKTLIFTQQDSFKTFTTQNC